MEFVFDGYKCKVVADGANGYVVRPEGTDGILVKYTCLQVFTLDATGCQLSRQEIKRRFARGMYTIVKERINQDGRRIVVVKMFGPYPSWHMLAKQFQSSDLVLLDIRTDLNKGTVAAFLPCHENFAPTYEVAPGVLIMKDCGRVLAKPWDTGSNFDDMEREQIIDDVVNAVVFALEHGIPLIDIKPDNVCFDGVCARVIDTDAAILHEDERISDHTSFRCSLGHSQNNPVLACLVGLAIVVLVVSGASYRDLVLKYHFEQKSWGTLNELAVACEQRTGLTAFHKLLTPSITCAEAIEQCEEILAR